MHQAQQFKIFAEKVRPRIVNWGLESAVFLFIISSTIVGTILVLSTASPTTQAWSTSNTSDRTTLQAKAITMEALSYQEMLTNTCKAMLDGLDQPCPIHSSA